MLSRVAERIYWTARYLQRVESAARLVNVYTNLLMDLPKDVDISWFNLVSLNSAEDEYEARYKVRDERNVVKFTLADDTNSSSMLVSLAMVRENLRTTRDVMPENAWELINELTSFANDSIKNGGLNRGKRHEFLTQVINQCQLIQGYVASTLSHDDVWDMWCIGRDLERADMTTRILDAGANVLFAHDYREKNHVPLIVWGSVLRSSGADHAYRRNIAASVVGYKVVNFLISDEHFPRSVNYCLQAIFQGVKSLPRGRKVMTQINALDIIPNDSKKKSPRFFSELDKDLSEYLNDLQLKIGQLHQIFLENWFKLD
ncbi:MAG: alpha-E domain-containing protein [Cellvibrionaceae bacterium]